MDRRDFLRRLAAAVLAAPVATLGHSANPEQLCGPRTTGPLPTGLNPCQPCPVESEVYLQLQSGDG